MADTETSELEALSGKSLEVESDGQGAVSVSCSSVSSDGAGNVTLSMAPGVMVTSDGAGNVTLTSSGVRVLATAEITLSTSATAGKVDSVEREALAAQSIANAASSQASSANTMAEAAQNRANAAARTATDYLRFTDEGLVVGDMTASGLGKNVRIDADSVDIRDGDSTLASFSHSETSPIGEARSCTNLESSGTDDLNVIAPDGLLRLMAGTGDLSTLSGVVVGGNSVTLGAGDGETDSPFGGGSVSVGADGVSIGSPEGVTVASGTAVKSLLSPFQVHAVSVHPSAATSLAAAWTTVPCATAYGSSGSLLSASGDGGVRCSRAGKVMCMASLYAQYAASAVIQLGFRTSSGREVGGTSTNSPGWNCGVTSAPTILEVSAGEVVYLMAADWNGSGASVPAQDATMLTVWYVE